MFTLNHARPCRGDSRGCLLKENTYFSVAVSSISRIRARDGGWYINVLLLRLIGRKWTRKASLHHAMSWTSTWSVDILMALTKGMIYKYWIYIMMNWCEMRRVLYTKSKVDRSWCACIPVWGRYLSTLRVRIYGFNITYKCYKGFLMEVFTHSSILHIAYEVTASTSFGYLPGT